MDTLTQAALGATVGALIAGKHAPRKALLWGAVVATLPDLDVFIPYDNDLDNFTLHRSWSHSWLMQSLIAPLLALLCYRTVPNSFSYKSWFWLIWLALATHSGLDALTVYGTQLFWPINSPPVSNGTIFIIDPMYTLPLLCGVITIAIWPDSGGSRIWLHNGFLISCCYLLWALGVQNIMYQQARLALLQQGIRADKVLVIATPFNTLLWRVVALNKYNYYEGFRSIFDDANYIHFTRYSRMTQLQKRLSNDQFVERLAWFTDDFYALKQADQTIIMSDLRMGLASHYVFSFLLAEKQKQNWVSLEKPEHIKSERQRSVKQLLLAMWHRIWQQRSTPLPTVN